MYLLACSALFLVAAAFKPIRRECLILFIASLLTGLFAIGLSPDGNARYWLRAAVTTSAAIALCGCRSKFGFYQASIYSATLIVYALLSFDVAQYTAWVQNGSIGLEPVSIVWGERYKELTHGLVILQLVGILPCLRSIFLSIRSSLHHSAANLHWVKRGEIK